MTTRRLAPDDLAALGHGKPERGGYALLIATVTDVVVRSRLCAGIDVSERKAQFFWGCVHAIVSRHLGQGNRLEISGNF